MPRIRNNISSTAAVSDTAAVASIARGPLHTASQGPLSPQAMDVFDTSIAAAARRAVAVSDTATFTVSDTVTSSVATGVFDTSIASQAQAQAQAVAVSDTAASTVVSTPVAVVDTALVSSLKKALKYSSRQQIEAQWQSLPVDAFHINEEHEEDVHRWCFDVAQEENNKEWFDEHFWPWKKPQFREDMEEVLVAFANEDDATYNKNFTDLKAKIDNTYSKTRDRGKQAVVFHTNFQAITAESRATKVSFGSVTATQYVLSEEDEKQRAEYRVKEKLPPGAPLRGRNCGPHRAQSYHARGGFSERAVLNADDKDDTLLDKQQREQQQAAAEKDWKEHGNKQALELDQQPLPRTHVAFVFSLFGGEGEQTQPDVIDTSGSAHGPQQSTEPAITDMAVQSTPVASSAAAVVDTAAVQVQVQVQSTALPSDVVDTSMADDAATVVDTAAVQGQVQSTSLPSDVVDTSMATGAVPTTQAVPLRRSARIAAQQTRTQTPSRRRRVANASAATSVRRTTPRTGAVKPKGYYKV